MSERGSGSGYRGRGGQGGGRGRTGRGSGSGGTGSGGSNAGYGGSRGRGGGTGSGGSNAGYGGNRGRGGGTGSGGSNAGYGGSRGRGGGNPGSSVGRGGSYPGGTVGRHSGYITGNVGQGGGGRVVRGGHGRVPVQRGGGFSRGSGSYGGGGRRDDGSKSWPTPEVCKKGLTKADWDAAKELADDEKERMSSQSEPPIRPGSGKAGTPLQLQANHFHVQFKDHYTIHRYDVSIDPEIPLKKLNKEIMIEVVERNINDFNNLVPAYDGRKGLYTTSKLQFESKEFILTEDRAENSLLNFLESTDSETTESVQDIIQAFDIVLRSAKNLKSYVPSGRSLFHHTMGIENLCEGFDCWPGFYQSLRPTQMGLSLNIDTSARAFYKAGPVTDFLVGYLKNNRLINQNLRPEDRYRILKALKGVTIQITHGSQRKYKVWGISSLSSDDLVFNHEGTQKSVSQYFLDKYTKTLQYPSLPCIEVRIKIQTNPVIIYLPMEVCNIVEGQRYLKKDDYVASKLSEKVSACPAARANKILNIVEQNGYSGDDLVKNFGLEIENNFTSVQARLLPPPTLLYKIKKHNHPAAELIPCQPEMGNWNMITLRSYEEKTLDSWSIINFSNMLDDADVRNFGNRLLGFLRTDRRVPQAWKEPIFEISNTVDEINIGVIKSALSKIRANYLENPIQLLVIILPDTEIDYYGNIKRICDTELGIVSQCLRSKNVWKSSVLHNVALKINVKIGGRNNVLLDVSNGNIPIVTEEETIIFGADVTHPPAGEETPSVPSIAAVVASMDWPHNVRYKGLVRAQPARTEIISELFIMVKELLELFRQSIGVLPRRIIFYRDGVSEGEFSKVLASEIPAIKDAYKSLGRDNPPTITFIVVQKRHKTRLFPSKEPSMADKSGNILPGTVVDTQICHPSQYDFYLCSHAGVIGTSKPVHYHVLCDENKFTPDFLQLFTNSLCYTYALCTRSVSKVPPVCYAHLAAFRARFYIQEETNAEDNVDADADADAEVNFQPLLEITGNVKDYMYFC